MYKQKVFIFKGLSWKSKVEQVFWLWSHGRSKHKREHLVTEEAGSLITAGIMQGPSVTPLLSFPPSLPRTAAIKSPITSEHHHTRDQASST